MEKTIKIHFFEKNTAIKTQKCLLYLGVFLMIFKTFCYCSAVIPWPEWIDDSLSVAIVISLMFAILLNEMTIKELIVFCLIGCLTVYTAWKAEYSFFVTTALLIIAIRTESLEKMGRFIFKCKFILISINTVVALILWANGLMQICQYYESGTRLRYSMGYGMPAHFAVYIFDLIMIWTFINYKKIKNIHYILMVLISIVVYILTDSRTILLTSILFLFLMWISIKIDISKITKICMQCIIPVLTAFMFIMIKMYPSRNAIAIVADKMVNSRIRLNGYKLEHYGLSFFPRHLNLDGSFDMTWLSVDANFDCVYTWMAIEVGIIWLILLMACFIYMGKKADVKISLMLITWALIALIDQQVLRGESSFAILLLTLLFGDNPYKKKKYVNQKAVHKRKRILLNKNS